MRFLADECVDAAAVAALRAAGHDVRTVQEIRAGLTDAEVLEFAAEQQRLLLTEDKDFDIGPMRNVLGVEPVPLEQGLALTFAPAQTSA